MKKQKASRLQDATTRRCTPDSSRGKTMPMGQQRHKTNNREGRILLAQSRSRDFARGVGNDDAPEAGQRYYPRAGNF